MPIWEISMFVIKEDLRRFISTRVRLHKKRSVIKQHLDKYCLQLLDNTTPLSKAQMEEVHRRWEKFAFAHPVSPYWHQLYTNKTGVFDADYISDELQFYFIENKLINYDYIRGFTDKNYLQLLFPDINQPSTVIRCIQGLFYDASYTPVTLQEAIQLIQNHLHDGIVIKPSINSWAGRNISFHKGSLSSSEIAQILSDSGKNYIVQGIIRQHAALAAIHPESVNTIRMITMLLDGEVTVLSACLRMGVGSSQVDNFSQGGIACGIQENGCLRSIGHDRLGNTVPHHPSGFHFETCTIPNYHRVLSVVKRAALRVPQFGIASWDFAMDESGEPVLIEYNVGKGGIDLHQYANGPLYGEKTDRVLDYVFKDYCYENSTLSYNYNVFSDHITIKTGSKHRKHIHNVPSEPSFRSCGCSRQWTPSACWRL